MPTALVILANGFEDIEAMTIIDILRRGDIDVTVAGLESLSITSAHNTTIAVTETLADNQDKIFDTVILPGGEPGTTHLENSREVEIVIKSHHAQGKLIAAICAAPRVLDKIGVISGKRATSYPTFKEAMTSCTYSEEAVVVDDNFITSRGPATAHQFAFAILENLNSITKVNELKEAMLYNA